MRFLVLDLEWNSEPLNRILPVILAVPEDVRLPLENEKSVLQKAISQDLSISRRWKWNKKFVLSEQDAANSPEIAQMFNFVDWENVPKVWLSHPENYSEAYDYVKLIGPAQSVEHLIAGETNTAYRYAMDILCGRFPAGEEAISMDSLKSLNYARMAKCRILPAEEKICKDEELSSKYGKIMKEYNLWGSWTNEEISRSPVWMYQYAKDHAKGSLPENLHNMMHMMSLCEGENKWIRKYLGSKKYMSNKGKKR